MIICVATDGREDFEKSLVLSEEELLGKASDSPLHLLSKGKKVGRLELLNRLSIGILEGALNDDFQTE